MRLITSLVLGGCLLIAQSALAHGPLPSSLIGVPIPPVPGLLDGSAPIVVNKDAAIALGKALFWDMNVGSDGMSCGSCHFHAGADNRVKNQINPGLKSSVPSGQSFQPLPSNNQPLAEGGAGGANYTLKANDFPTYQFNNPLNKASGVKFETDDVVSSSGTFSGAFQGASRFTGTSDDCARSADPIFHVNSAGTRRVEPRNAPTVINTIFNHRNFWDGRANNIYNGSSPWGNRDPNAGVWVKVNARSVTKQRLNLQNSSLASLAMGPPLNDAEMSCQQRSWPNIGRKLLLRRPLQNQKVHSEDSVLGIYSLSTAGNLQPGLNTTYQSLITKAFNPKYWSYSGNIPVSPPPGQPPYNQLEANFSMFFGLALQLYQGTLVSDQAPIDLTPRTAENRPTWEGMGKSPEEIARLNNGFSLFFSNHCNLCHAGSTTTLASLATNTTISTPTTPPTYFGPSHSLRAFGPNAMGPAGAAAAGINRYLSVVTRDLTSSAYKLMDLGFVNTGVIDPESDPGVAGVDDFGHPLSFAAQYVQYLLDNTAGIYDPGINQVRACDFLYPIGYKTNVSDLQITTNAPGEGVIADGSKEGTLRNQNCLLAPLWGSNAAYIPTAAAAAANLANPNKMAIATQAAFKIPSLRNIELTGPYMHNGSMATLEQVVEFYSRQANVDNPNLHNLINSVALAGDAGQEVQAAQNRADLIEFLKTLTDERVRYERAPFDHPEVIVPNGHLGNNQSVTAGNPLNPGLAVDDALTIPAVGSSGAANPLLPFESNLAPAP